MKKLLLVMTGAALASLSLVFFNPFDPVGKESTHDVLPEEVPQAAAAPVLPPPPPPPVTFAFVEVIDSCGSDHAGTCLNARTAPSSDAPAALKLRTGMVLAVATTTVTDETGREWYRIMFREWLRYPERMSGTWYVASDYVRHFEEVIPPDAASTTKRIVIDRSEQMLYAYEDDVLFMTSSVSTGRDLTPTPRGVFSVYRKTPSRYMQGPLPGISDQYYDLPGVPWSLYFTQEGGAIHGAYWHDQFGTQWSHGCVNLPLEEARKLYEWAPLGTEVVVHD